MTLSEARRILDRVKAGATLTPAWLIDAALRTTGDLHD